MRKTMKSQIIHLVKTTCGGAVTFHDLNDLCLRVNERDELERVTWDASKRKNRYTPYNVKNQFRRIFNLLKNAEPLEL